MSRLRERRWPQFIAGYTFMLLALAGMTTIGYVSAVDIHRPLVIRLAVAALLAIVLIQAHSNLRRAMAYEPPSDFESALRLEPTPPGIDPLLVKLRDELKHSVADRQYFEHILWPRLLSLVEGRSQQRVLEQPEPGWIPRKGPSLRALTALIKGLEDRR